MFGTISQEMEVNVPASQAWELYGPLQLAKLLGEQPNNVLDRVEVVPGDGKVGTVLNIVFFTSSYKEKFTKVADENRVKEAEVVEGGYLDVGFTLYRVRFEIIQKSKESCITRSTVAYDLKEDAAANTSMVSIQPLVMVMEAAANYLMNKNIGLRGLVECTKRKYEIEHENALVECVFMFQCMFSFHVPNTFPLIKELNKKIAYRQGY